MTVDILSDLEARGLIHDTTDRTALAARLAAAEAEELSEITELPDPVEDMLADEVTARGRQSNLSFFAFTATPKARTLELFGTRDEAAGPPATARGFQ